MKEQSDLNNRTIILLFVAFALIFFMLLSANEDWLVTTGDTLLYKSSYDTIGRFSTLFSSLNADPLQGLFDILPSGMLLEPLPNMVARSFSGTDFPILTFYTSCGILLAFSLY